MRCYGITALLTFASVCAAQNGVVASTEPSSLQVFPLGSCPIGVEARQQQSTQYLFADSAGPAIHPLYTVNFATRDSRRIREVALELVGPTGPHREEVASRSPLKQDAVESFTLARMSNPDVATARLTAVRWIDLVRITYSDGTTWNRGPENTCRVSPNGFIPVQQLPAVR